MRKSFLLIFCLVSLIFSAIVLCVGDSTSGQTCKALNSSVFIYFAKAGKDSGKGYFSGTLVCSQGFNYVLTCGHAFEEFEKDVDEVWITRPICDTQGNVLQLQYSQAELINLSLSEESGGQDIAVLRLEDKLADHGAIFYTSKLKVFKDFTHIGNPYGTYINAAIPGKIAKLDMERTYEGTTTHFVIVSCEVREGCSGGGIFIDSSYAGMVLRADKYGFGLVRDVKYIRQYLEENDLGFIAKGR